MAVAGLGFNAECKSELTRPVGIREAEPCRPQAPGAPVRIDAPFSEPLVHLVQPFPQTALGNGYVHMVRIAALALLGARARIVAPVHLTPQIRL